MGTVLAIVSWLSILLYALGLLVVAAVLRFEDKIGLNRGELPEGITLDMTVGELLAADHSFLQSHMGLFGVHFSMALIFYIVLSVILLRIAIAWRRAEPFQKTTVLGLRWLGILLLGQWVSGIIYQWLAPNSLSMLLTNSTLYDLALGLFSGTYGVNLEASIIFLTLSWVLEHGRMLKDEQDMTI